MAARGTPGHYGVTMVLRAPASSYSQRCYERLLALYRVRLPGLQRAMRGRVLSWERCTTDRGANFLQRETGFREAAMDASDRWEQQDWRVRKPERRRGYSAL
jgi:hypothetical protein